jgi:hypothetical protein
MPYSSHVADLRSGRLRPYAAAAWAEAGTYSTDDLVYIIGHAGYRQGLKAEVAWRFATEAADGAEEVAAAEEERKGRDEAEMRDYLARCAATDEAVLAATTAVAAAGWAVQWRHGSRGGSIYYWITEPGEEGERYSLRISDHHAPGGAGWSDEKQERHAEPDINIVIRRGAGGDYTFDLNPLIETLSR